MPLYEYSCEADIFGHTVEKFFKTFDDAKPYIDEFICPEHGQIAKRVVSSPYPAHLLGDPEGYHKPSPTKRFSTKTVSQQDGNTYAA